MELKRYYRVTATNKVTGELMETLTDTEGLADIRKTHRNIFRTAVEITVDAAARKRAQLDAAAAKRAAR